MASNLGRGPIEVGQVGSEVTVIGTDGTLYDRGNVVSSTAAMTPSTAVSSALTTAMNVSTSRTGNIIKTTMYIDLIGAKGTTTLSDIVGDTGASHFGQITTAVNGAIYAGQVSCAVVPTTGPDDIDISVASVATGAYDADVTALTNYAQLVDSNGAHAIGTVKPFTALPTADYYLYLSSGETGTAGTYDAGTLIIEMWGLAS